MQDVVRRHARAFARQFKDSLFGLRRAGIDGGDHGLKQMGDADFAEVCITVGHRDQWIMLMQDLQGRHDIRVEAHFVARRIEYLVRLLGNRIVITAGIGHALHDGLAQKTQIMPAVRVFLLDGKTQLHGIVSSERCGYCRKMTCQPFRQPFLGSEDHRHQFPQRVIEVDRQCVDTIQMSVPCGYGPAGGNSSANQDALELSLYNRRNRRKGNTMKYLHTMVRVSDLDESLHFYCDLLGMREIRRYDNEQGRFTLVFVAAPGDEQAPLELTHNWDEQGYDEGRNFGHVAYRVDNIYAFCQKLLDAGVTINRPPRDGRMAFVRSPDNISIELLQAGDALAPKEPWASMPNSGHW